jgi:PHD/YefM family antitoxin component YafN of YafNO toxin-antitoxin module
MEIRLAESLAKHSDELLDDIVRNGKSILITKNDETRAIILDYSSYKQLREAFCMLKLLEKSEIDYRNGKIFSHEELKQQMAEKINKLKKANVSELQD